MPRGRETQSTRMLVKRACSGLIAVGMRFVPASSLAHHGNSQGPACTLHSGGISGFGSARPLVSTRRDRTRPLRHYGAKQQVVVAGGWCHVTRVAGMTEAAAMENVEGGIVRRDGEADAVCSIDVARVDPDDLGFDARHSARKFLQRDDGGAEDPANSPRQRFLVTAHRLKAEIPRLMDPTSISQDLLCKDLLLVDNTIQLSVRGRGAHDLVLGVAAAGTKLALINPSLNMLSYKACAHTRRITCRWQIVGTPRLPLTVVHHDRVSIFDVGPSGKITQHTIDRIRPPSSRLDKVLAQLLFPWHDDSCRHVACKA
eukprot:m.399159 g.399159  ORF g.399159 m.399159 type:complete len:314 (-) comp28379_c0_seq1:149-1090(-)